MQSFTQYLNFAIHKLLRIQVLGKLFAIGVPYKHCSPTDTCCLPVKRASKSVISVIFIVQHIHRCLTLVESMDHFAVILCILLAICYNDRGHFTVLVI